MIGFPKTLTDFSKYKPSFSPKKEWKNYFEKQTNLYLENQDFFSQKTESWKHFPFQKVMGQDFVFSSPDASLPKENITPYFSPSLLIFIQNGTAFPTFKSAEGLLFCPWKEFLSGKVKLNSTIKEKILLTLKEQRNPFCSLNNALYENGFILVIKKSLSRPLEIHYTQNEANSLQGINLRNFIFMEKEASAQILEVFHEQEERKPLFLNVQTDCFIGNKANLEHTRLDQTGNQDILINHLFSELSRESKACFFSLSLNANIARWHSELNQEEKSTSEIRGLSLLEGKKYSDHKVAVKHTGIEGVSRQLYKSFLFDSARQIFQGFVSIEKQAQKSDTSQLSKNFLFGKRALAVAFPELDISADDVKASHGATVSPFAENRDLVFYLKSRGINQLQAFHLVLSGLIKEVFSCLQPNTQFVLKPVLEKKLNSIEPSVEGIF